MNTFARHLKLNDVYTIDGGLSYYIVSSNPMKNLTTQRITFNAAKEGDTLTKIYTMGFEDSVILKD
jgi:hypothetical protein